MAGVTIDYKGSTIATIQGTGSKTLKTQGKYCEGDILVDYVKEGITPSGTKSIASNGTHDVTNYANVNVSVAPNVAPMTTDENGTYYAADDGVDGYSSVTIDVPPNVTTKSISSNGTYNAFADNVDGYSRVTVNVSPNVTSKSINANGTYNASADSVDGYSQVTVAVPTGATNVYSQTFTLATHQSSNVTLFTLPDDVYSHRNDDTFTVVAVNTTPASLESYDDYYLLACNNPNNPKVGSYTSYGVGLRKNSATAVGINQVYYPPNSTDNAVSLGGAGKFWLNGKVLNYRPAGYYLGAGTYMILVAW